MLCLGLDPKADLSHISSILAKSESSLVPPAVAKTGHDHTSKHTHGPSHTDDSTHGPSHTKDRTHGPSHTAGQANGVGIKPRLLTAILSTSEGSGQNSMTTPTIAMVLTGCRAIMQFVGNKEAISGSLIQSGESCDGHLCLWPCDLCACDLVLLSCDLCPDRVTCALVT